MATTRDLPLEERPDYPTSSPATYFAPAGRATPEQLTALSEFIENEPLFNAVLEAADGYVMVLNEQRQVLAANRSLLDALKENSSSCLLGNRPGEVLGCIHAHDGPDGCGTSKACESCGAAIAILDSQCEGRPINGECLATIRKNDKTESREFRVRATPVAMAGHSLTVLVFIDISGEKRREALERVFFHDILNTVGGLMGWSGLLECVDDLDPREAAQRILALSIRLKQEIENQWRLNQAESATLELNPETAPVERVLATLTMLFETHPVSINKTLDIDAPAPEATITTDVSLLTRVLANMIKNALEAIAENKAVRVWFEPIDGGGGAFHVRNPGVIPDAVARRIFQRSFSTKAETGRGIGAYSMKLFGEDYLGGKVTFTSHMPEGTTFSITLPPESPTPVVEAND